MKNPGKAPFPVILAGLEAAAEITRLRLLALLAEAELTVSELVTILGQSQPRISRHLKLLVEAGLIERHREGAWAFFRMADRGARADLSRDILSRIETSDPLLTSDRTRLDEARRARSEAAGRYFADHAPEWDRIRSLHVAEDKVEAAIMEVVGHGPLGTVLDLGTGTGRMIELIAPLAERVVGVDQSHAMLNVARARLERAGVRNAQLRQGDIYALPVERNRYDLVVIHRVLHYLDDPGRAVREAARIIRPGGRLIVVDFAPHTHEFMREQHAHRRLGFAAAEIADFMREADLDMIEHRDLRPGKGEADRLTVSIWVGRDRRIQGDALPITHAEMA
jgi:ubiquinone/menaquinone biosynthesis C-methylase UbiE